MDFLKDSKTRKFYKNELEVVQPPADKLKNLDFEADETPEPDLGLPSTPEENVKVYLDQIFVSSSEKPDFKAEPEAEIPEKRTYGNQSSSNGESNVKSEEEIEHIIAQSLPPKCFKNKQAS